MHRGNFLGFLEIETLLSKDGKFLEVVKKQYLKEICAYLYEIENAIWNRRDSAWQITIQNIWNAFHEIDPLKSQSEVRTYVQIVLDSKTITWDESVDITVFMKKLRRQVIFRKTKKSMMENCIKTNNIFDGVLKAHINSAQIRYDANDDRRDENNNFNGNGKNVVVPKFLHFSGTIRNRQLSKCVVIEIIRSIWDLRYKNYNQRILTVPKISVCDN